MASGEFQIIDRKPERRGLSKAHFFVSSVVLLAKRDPMVAIGIVVCVIVAAILFASGVRP
jgi:hypothetical protein